jgi:hypothetical protein
MKDCKDCEFFNGWDYSDGTPHCCYEDGNEHGYEYCPFNDSANVKHKGMKIEIDAGFMSDYIRHTIKNTVDSKAYTIAKDEIKSIIDDEIKKKIRDEMGKQVESVVSAAIEEFMSKDITVGGGWCEPERTITRQAYLAEMIEKELKDQFKSDVIKSQATKTVQDAINSYDRKLRDEINAGIKTTFDTATRHILTENVVNMLMCNDTYQKLSNSMQTFLPKHD